MIYVVDASALLNLSNGQVLENVLGLPNCSFAFGSLVHEEIPTLAGELAQFLSAGMVTRLDDLLLPAAEFLRMKDQYRLGDGETECLIAARSLNATLVADDQAARRVAIGYLGAKRITGTIGLLRICVGRGRVAKVNAYEAYRMMKAHGGFLPEMGIDEMFP